MMTVGDESGNGIGYEGIRTLKDMLQDARFVLERGDKSDAEAAQQALLDLIGPSLGPAIEQMIADALSQWEPPEQSEPFSGISLFPVHEQGGGWEYDDLEQAVEAGLTAKQTVIFIGLNMPPYWAAELPRVSIWTMGGREELQDA